MSPAIERAALLLDVLGGSLQEAHEHVINLWEIEVEKRDFWERVLWCLEAKGNA